MKTGGLAPCGSSYTLVTRGLLKVAAAGAIQLNSFRPPAPPILEEADGKTVGSGTHFSPTSVRHLLHQSSEIGIRYRGGIVALLWVNRPLLRRGPASQDSHRGRHAQPSQSVECGALDQCFDLLTFEGSGPEPSSKQSFESRHRVLRQAPSCATGRNTPPIAALGLDLPQIGVSPSGDGGLVEPEVNRPRPNSARLYSGQLRTCGEE